PSGRRFWATTAQINGMGRGELRIGDTATGRPVGSSMTLDGWVDRVIFDASEKRVAVSSRSRLPGQLRPGQQQLVTLFDVATGRALGNPIEIAGWGYGQ